MKKIFSIITAVMLIMSLCITANAACDATINGNNSVTVGRNIEFTVSVNGCGDATSIAVAVSFDGGFELVSGNWLKIGSISKFDTATNKGALGGLSSPDVNGNLFKLVLKAKTASANTQSVSVNVIAKNGSTEIMNVTHSKSVKIVNATGHDWSNKDGICTICGAECEHDWADGECSICGKKQYAPGDANGDGRINNKDLGLLMQYINGWDVEISDAVVDVNADGRVNNKDYGLLMQYINGWDVVLG